MAKKNKLGKEAFIVETVLRLIIAKTSSFGEHGISLRQIGWKPNKVEFGIHRKTKWQILKNLEKESYVKREGKKYFMGERLMKDLRPYLKEQYKKKLK